MSDFFKHIGHELEKVNPVHIAHMHIPHPVGSSRIRKDSAHQYVDLKVQFIGASELPKMDVVGSADPYFVATLDEGISYVSTVIPDTLAPVWNEVWIVKNVPKGANLKIQVYDKDNGAPIDDYIGSFDVSIAPGAKEAEIEKGPFKRKRGMFWLNIESKPSNNSDQLAYVFDGPIHYSRHYSPTIGRLTNINDARLYCTWKMYLRQVKVFLGDNEQQHWNTEYKAAQSIFRLSAFAVRSTIQAGHKMLYARSTTNSFGVLNDAGDVLQVLCSGPTREDFGKKFAQRVKPAIYTYVIAVDDDTFRFSETGAAYFVDYASKHALHSNVAETVRYSGEFHPRPACGWENFDDTMDDRTTSWELFIDNNSGTYAPDKNLLPKLQALLELNFPNFTIKARDRDDEDLKQSVQACRDYALKKRGVKESELQPHIGEGEETLNHRAASLREDGGGHRLSNPM